MLFEARTTNGLTQHDVAQRLGLPQSFVSKYETGERRLDLIEFLQVADALEINSVEFVQKLLGRLE